MHLRSVFISRFLLLVPCIIFLLFACDDKSDKAFIDNCDFSKVQNPKIVNLIDIDSEHFIDSLRYDKKTRSFIFPPFTEKERDGSPAPWSETVGFIQKWKYDEKTETYKIDYIYNSNKGNHKHDDTTFTQSQVLELLLTKHLFGRALIAGSGCCDGQAESLVDPAKNLNLDNFKKFLKCYKKTYSKLSKSKKAADKKQAKHLRSLLKKLVDKRLEITNKVLTKGSKEVLDFYDGAKKEDKKKVLKDLKAQKKYLEKLKKKLRKPGIKIP